MAVAPLSREEIIARCAAAPEQVADLVLALYARVQALEERVRELERRLGLNSSKSGKPPSSDGYQKPAPKSPHTKSGRPAVSPAIPGSAWSSGRTPTVSSCTGRARAAGVATRWAKTFSAKPRTGGRSSSCRPG
jgi:hypothetical protein